MGGATVVGQRGQLAPAEMRLWGKTMLLPPLKFGKHAVNDINRRSCPTGGKPRGEGVQGRGPSPPPPVGVPLGRLGRVNCPCPEQGRNPNSQLSSVISASILPIEPQDHNQSIHRNPVNGLAWVELYRKSWWGKMAH